MSEAAEITRLRQEREDLEGLIATLRVWARAGCALCQDHRDWNDHFPDGDVGDRAVKRFLAAVRTADVTVADVETPLPLWLEWRREDREDAAGGCDIDLDKRESLAAKTSTQPIQPRRYGMPP